MFNIYSKYLINIFLTRFIKITLIFFSLTIIIGILEEISFFKDIDVPKYIPYFLTLLNSPITIFEIFPFIFLITTQFVIYNLFKSEEMYLLKRNGLSNFKIIRVFFIISLLIGIFNILVYYNISSTLKFHYSNIKNGYSSDNKYLAMVTDSGLWIKDEIDDNIFIIKSTYVESSHLTNAVINVFNSKFELIKTIQSKKIDFSDFKWKIYDPLISEENNLIKNEKIIFFKTNFNEEKIKNLFSNYSTLDIIKLVNLKNDFDKLGYSSDEIVLHLLTLFSSPIFYSIMTVLSAVMVFNLSKKKSILFHLIIGIFVSVVIYYIKYIFTSLGTNGLIPITLSIFFPIIIISLISIISLININEK